MCVSEPVSATPPPSTPPKASPPTPCTASSQARNPASSSTPCSPAAGTPTTSTSKSSATATPTPSSNPTPPHPARPPRRCSRSSPAMKLPSPPAPCSASSITQRPSSSRRSSATPTACTQPPSSWLAPRWCRCSTAKPTKSYPTSPTSRRGRPSEHTCSAWRRTPVSTRSSTCGQPPPDETSALPATWPPSSTGASQRSHLVADLAAEVQDHPCPSDAESVWAGPGAHRRTALIGEIAVWRAANGIDPQDLRPTGEQAHLETLPALWKQRLDRHIARSADPSDNARFNERQATHTAPRRRHDDSQRRYQTPGPNGPATPGR